MSKFFYYYKCCVYRKNNNCKGISLDVVKLYYVETKRINEEISNLSLRSQSAILNKNNNIRGQHYKHLPYVLIK